MSSIFACMGAVRGLFPDKRLFNKPPHRQDWAGLWPQTEAETGAAMRLLAKVRMVKVGGTYCQSIWGIQGNKNSDERASLLALCAT
mmetsp:Transcript_40322/g.65485  ORF Transcript_40322/g.65485 Transcript_40322/m.65485 type:complete len:86 (-) Transcript_40322:333-590(-)